MTVMLTFKIIDEVVLWCYHSNEPLWLDFLIVLFLSFDVTICSLGGICFSATIKSTKVTRLLTSNNPGPSCSKRG